MRLLALFFILIFGFIACSGSPQTNELTSDVVKEDTIHLLLTGAEQTQMYFPELAGKRVAIVANHTSRIANIHLVDSLLSAGMNVVKVFTPEHGFRGLADAGASVSSGVDDQTGLSIVSLYGNNKKPKVDQLENVDIVVFDIQDVGARFYTYISTMHYVMEACAENNIPFMVLDRPNPNGFYVDGPILEKEYQSFVGMHPVPTVHGMTVGEYAKMINGEAWLSKGVKCNLSVIPIKGYHHSYKYQLPIQPSPNLPNMEAIYLYPSLCFFEGTEISVGRGTDFPFQQVGHPDLSNFDYAFTPSSRIGASDPPLKNQKCYGFFFNKDSVQNWMDKPRINLEWLRMIYNEYPKEKNFFNNYFNLLAGNKSLKKSIQANKSEGEIRSQWKEGLAKFMKTREKYLLYEDF